MSSNNGNERRRDFSILSLGPRKVVSPYKASHYVDDGERVLHETRWCPASEARPPWESNGESGDLPAFEVAGPREKIYFDPTKTRCGIVTCGGLSPGINDVIRAIVLQLHYYYGVHTIHGFRYGFEGLVPDCKHETMMLTPEAVSHVHQQGGTMLSSSRGGQDPAVMVDTLERLNIQILFCLGGDGTMRGALDISKEAQQRGLKIAVIGVPKTIDNDILYTDKTFGFETAYSIAAEAIRGAHVEATGAPYGIGVLKLMGRHSGFIAAHAVLASRDANFVLVPEVDFELGGANGFLPHLLRRLRTRHHAVVVVAEGAGQHLIEDDSNGQATDPSGNVKLKDIGAFMRDRISEYLKLVGVPFNLKYIDPSYLIRSSAATPSDSLLAGIYGQMAAHAAMAGKTGMLVGNWHGHFTHVPIEIAVSGRKTIDPTSNFWQSVVECTGQPRSMTNAGVPLDDVEESLRLDADVAAHEEPCTVGAGGF
ncbi:MAG: ATP-dependent 6-phosphofructokinase [Planctomycetota bacterium]